MLRLTLLTLAACGGSVRRGDPLPATLVQPNSSTFSDPRPLEDWLPSRDPGTVRQTQAWPQGPYRISSTLLQSTQYSQADAYTDLVNQAAQSGVDQVRVMAEGEGEQVIQAHLGFRSWVGRHSEHDRAWFGFHQGTQYAMSGVGVITAPVGSEPYAGIECQSWTPGMAELSTSDLGAAYISRVAAGSPAEAAGLHGGQFVLAWADGRMMGTGGCTALNAFLHGALQADPHVSLAIWEPAMGQALVQSLQIPAAFGPLGISVNTMEHREVRAPMVVATDQRAEHLGFHVGDLVLAVDGSEVHWKRDLHDALTSAGFPMQSRAITIEIGRFGAGRWVPLTITAVPADRYQEVLP